MTSLGSFYFDETLSIDLTTFSAKESKGEFTLQFTDDLGRGLRYQCRMAGKVCTLSLNRDGVSWDAGMTVISLAAVTQLEEDLTMRMSGQVRDCFPSMIRDWRYMRTEQLLGANDDWHSDQD